MLKALVLTPNTKTTELGSILAIARSEARKREHSKKADTLRKTQGNRSDFGVNST